MSDGGERKPTASVPILVGTGPAVEIAAELYLVVAEWALREDESITLLASPPGELSGWISELFAKDIQFERLNVSERDKGAVQREKMREAIEIMIDPNKKHETQLLGLLGKIPSGAVEQIVESIQKGDKASFSAIRARIEKPLWQEFVKNMTPESATALGALVGRTRALRAVALCIVLYKRHLLSLIAEARGGDPRAVLKLIKIDKLFLSDSCTAQVIHQAELKFDRDFFKRLAKAITYKPKTRWRQSCKLYMYVILSSPLPLPASTILWGRIDPDGSRFKTSGAFLKFVERCRKEFSALEQAAASIAVPNARREVPPAKDAKS
jgi:ribosomal protein L18